ncbi:MAG TPA: hypothetical protein VF026_31490 [Ktedonobacteraceae bacterium]
MKGGWEGLYGRPRPGALAPSLEERDRLPPTGDHKGPLHIRSATLAPTDGPASCLPSQLSLMPIGVLAKDPWLSKGERRKRKC